MKSSYDLSIVIPVYNEEKRLPKNLTTIIDFIKTRTIKSEIILVDDGSKDNTWDILKKFQSKYRDINLFNIKIFHHEVNRGKGAAVKTGILQARGKLSLMTDCDLSTPIEELDLLIDHAKDYDIVIGSRRLSEKKLGRLPQKYRTLLGDIYYELLRLILLPSIKDTNCGFKLFSQKVIKPVFLRQNVNRWGYDAEILFIANKLNFSIKEVSVKWSHFGGSKVKIIDAILNTFKELLQIKINSWQGKYN